MTGGRWPTETLVAGGRWPTETLVAGGRWPTETLVAGGRWPTETLVAGGRWPTETLVAEGRWPTETLVAGGRWPTETLVTGGRLCPCALALALCAWLPALLDCWFKISCLSVIGSCSAVILSLCVQTSQADRPSLRMREFNFAVASTNVTIDTGPRRESCTSFLNQTGFRLSLCQQTKGKLLRCQLYAVIFGLGDVMSP